MLTPRRCKPDSRRRHQTEDCARCATCEPVGLQEQRAERTGEQRSEVEQREAHPADGRFEQLAQLEQQQHVHADVKDAVVQEARRDQPVVLAVLDEGLRESDPEFVPRAG